MSWEERWMNLSLLVSTWSKDRSRKIGCVIVDARNVLVSIGWNGFPRGVDDDIKDRHMRPQKYKWSEHAERNAIYNAAANGVKCLGCLLYQPWFPCADCARAIIQAGISKIICVEPDWDDTKYSDDFRISDRMLREAGVEIHFVKWLKPPRQKKGN